MARHADSVDIEIVIGGVSPKPSHGRIAVFNLCGERRLARKTQFEARHGVTVAAKTNYRNVLLFSAAAPARSMDPKDNRRWAGGVLRTIEIKLKLSTVDAFVNQISVDGRIRNLHRVTPGRGRLRCRSAEGDRNDYVS